MHSFFIRAVGQPHESWQEDAIQRYVQRLKPLAKVEILEAKEGHEGSNKPNEQRTREREAEKLLYHLPAQAFVVALDEGGKNLDSITLSRNIETWTEGGRPLVFLIGGSWGLDPSVRERADIIISFGKQTLPHILARITLLEQLYRTETILHHKEYHK